MAKDDQKQRLIEPPSQQQQQSAAQPEKKADAEGPAKGSSGNALLVSFVLMVIIGLGNKIFNKVCLSVCLTLLSMCRPLTHRSSKRSRCTTIPSSCRCGPRSFTYP
jgi:hypothetical protein